VCVCVCVSVGVVLTNDEVARISMSARRLFKIQVWDRLLVVLEFWAPQELHNKTHRQDCLLVRDLIGNVAGTYFSLKASTN